MIDELIDRIENDLDEMLEDMYRPDKKPLCSGRHNFSAKGVRIKLSSGAMIRLSVLITEIGRRLAGV